MPVIDWAAATWEDIDAADRFHAIAVLPVGAIEAHGPHLPLATDVVIAEAMARAGAARLAAPAGDGRSRTVFVLPPVTYTAAGFAAGFPGTLSVAAAAVTTLILDIARALAARDIAILALANAHLDPAHLQALAAAVTAADREGLRIVHPDLTRKPWPSRLSAEFQSGACHAGRFESSVVLAERPELVREDVRASLPSNPASLSVAIRDGKRTFIDAGGPRAYFGAPAEATAAEGRDTIQALGQILAEAVLAATA